MAYDQIYNEYNALNDPRQQQAEINRRIDLANPSLQRLLESLGSQLNMRGLYSSAPMTRATSRATGDFANAITTGYFQDADERRMGLLDIIARIEQAKEERKAANRRSLFGGIGGLLGSLLPMIPGLGGTSEIDKLMQLLGSGGQIGTGEGNTYG